MSVLVQREMPLKPQKEGMSVRISVERQKQTQYCVLLSGGAMPELWQLEIFFRWMQKSNCMGI